LTMGFRPLRTSWFIVGKLFLESGFRGPRSRHRISVPSANSSEARSVGHRHAPQGATEYGNDLETRRESLPVPGVHRQCAWGPVWGGWGWGRGGWGVAGWRDVKCDAGSASGCGVAGRGRRGRGRCRDVRCSAASDFLPWVGVGSRECWAMHRPSLRRLVRSLAIVGAGAPFGERCCVRSGCGPARGVRRSGTVTG
jgi:hypothetical protein